MAEGRLSVKNKQNDRDKCFRSYIHDQTENDPQKRMAQIKCFSNWTEAI